MMTLFERYVFKNIGLATFGVAIVLVVIIMLTQSMRFLELVIESGASGFSFLILTLLAVPRFFEIIFPLSLMIGVLSVYNRLISDSEMNVVRSSGASTLTLIRPAVFFGVCMTLLLLVIMLYVSPKSLAHMQHYSRVVKAQISSLLLQDGVFNHIDGGLTVYVDRKIGGRELQGVMVYDTRDTDNPPSVITAVRGEVVTNDDGYEIYVYDGSQQQRDPETNALSTLRFENYVLELPDTGAVQTRRKDPDERTITELLNPGDLSRLDQKARNELRGEIHRRFVSPFMALNFACLASLFLVLGSYSRYGIMPKILSVIGIAVILQTGFVIAVNVAYESVSGIVAMYMIVFMPFVFYGLSLREQPLIPYRNAGTA